MAKLEVFAIDKNRNRLNGSINYKSLIWHRRYYEPGEFSIVVPSSVFSMDWAYIVAVGRTELGMVQKVEYTDDVQSYAGADSVTVSGFFLEATLNDLVFLVEEPDSVEKYFPKPAGTSRKAPEIVVSGDGKYYSKDVSLDGTVKYRDVTTGVFDSSITDGDVSPVEIKPISGASYGNGSYSFWYSEYIDLDSGKLVSTSPAGYSYEYELISKPDVGAIQAQNTFTLLKDSDGNIRWCSGAGVSSDGDYYRQLDEWEAMTEGMEIVFLPGGQIGAKGYVKVKGPWQLRTGTSSGTPMDNVQQVIEWAQSLFAGQFLYDEPGFTGETKSIIPSLSRVGDVFFSEMKSIEAGVRLMYDFPDNSVVFSVWRGLDRTQSGSNAVSSASRFSAMASTTSEAQSFPAEYTKLEYIKASGTQYVNTGYKPGSRTKVEARFVLDGSSDFKGVFGGRTSSSTDSFALWQSQSGFRFDFADDMTQYNTSNGGDFPIVADGQAGTISIGSYGGKFSTGGSFTSSATMYLFVINSSDGVDSQLRCASGKLYYFRAYDGGSAVLDMVPCVRESDGAVGLYDAVKGKFHENEGAGSFVAGPRIDRLTLSYDGNSESASGSTSSQTGYEGESVTVAECGFSVSSMTFSGWNTSADGGGQTYMPGDSYVFGSSGQVLYAQWESVAPSGKEPWAVFADTWGTIKGYKATRDESNFRNTCYVLYDFWEPVWGDDGKPKVETRISSVESGSVKQYRVQSTENKGFWTVRLSDDQEDKETWIDKRDDGPDGMDSIKDLGGWSEDKPDIPDTVTKEKWQSWAEGCRNEALNKLKNDYGVIENLDTGTLEQSGYLTGWNLGDLVDVTVSTIGMKMQARVTEVEESYESGKSDVSITFGEREYSYVKRASLN